MEDGGLTIWRSAHATFYAITTRPVAPFGARSGGLFNSLLEVDPDGSVRRLRAGALERMWNIAARLDSLSQEYGDTPRAQVTRAVVSSPPPQKPLTDGQQAVWQALKGRCLSAKEIVSELKASSDDGVRKLVLELRKAGRMIETRRRRGYYRPDAPPLDDAAT